MQNNSMRRNKHSMQRKVVNYVHTHTDGLDVANRWSVLKKNPNMCTEDFLLKSNKAVCPW